PPGSCPRRARGALHSCRATLRPAAVLRLLRWRSFPISFSKLVLLVLKIFVLRSLVALRARSGYRLRAPAALTPAKRLYMNNVLTLVSSWIDWIARATSPAVESNLMFGSFATSGDVGILL